MASHSSPLIECPLTAQENLLAPQISAPVFVKIRLISLRPAKDSSEKR
jgi:hypothetical protein